MKKNTLRTMAIILAVIFVSNLATTVFGDRVNAAAAVDKQVQQDDLLNVVDNSYDFKDIQNYWAKDIILELSYMDILRGFDDKTMKPANNITREEYIAMLVRAIGMSTNGNYSQDYSDLPKTKWSFASVEAARQNGWLDIYEGSYIYPQKAITREEMAVIASKVVASLPDTATTVSFTDIDGSYQYKASIDKIAGLGIINGMPDGSFCPKSNATRAEAAAIISRLLKVNTEQSAETETALKDMVINYETSVYDSPNIGNYTFTIPLLNSIGKEKNQNQLRANVVKTLNSKGVNTKRYISDASAVINGITLYTAEATVTYNIVVDSGGFTSKEYAVTKKVYLKKSESGWVIYNGIPQFQYLEGLGGSKKINLVWHNVYGTTPNMSGTPKIEGLNVISPTWFTMTDGNGTVTSIAAAQYVQWAHDNGYKVWPLIGNEFDSAATNLVLTNSTKRAKVINSLINYAKQYKFDGINVDFENMYTKDKDNFTLFVKELTAKAKQNNLTVSVDVTVIAKNSNWSECYDRAALSQIADYIALMAYDQHWAGSQDSGSVAQLTWVDNSVKQVLKEVPAYKLILGMPFYTRVWKEDYSSGKTTPVVTSEAVSMATAEKRIADNKAKKVWDAASGQYYAEYTIGKAVYKIWLEDATSIKQKVALVNKYNLAGASAWRLGYETQQVWNAIADVLGQASNL